MGFYEIYYGRRQGKDEEWSHQACFFGNMYPAGSNIYYFNVYKAQQICRGSQSSYESCGRDRYFEHVCITGYLDDQSAMDPSDPHVPIMGLGLYLLVGLNGGTEKMRRRYQKIDEQLLPLLPENRKIQEKLLQKIPRAGNISSYIHRNAAYPVYQNTDVTYFDEAAKGLEAQLQDLAKAEQFIFMEYHAIEDAEPGTGFSRCWKTV